MIEKTVFDVRELEKVFRIVNGKLERFDKRGNLDNHKWTLVKNRVNQTQGYCQVSLNRKLYMYHVVLWVLFYKKNIPHGLMIDHINGNKIDNRIENLRIVTQRENSQNRKEHRDGILVGAIYRVKDKKYRSQIMINNKSITLGYYKTAEESHNAYKIAYQHMEEYVDNKSFRELIKKY